MGGVPSQTGSVLLGGPGFLERRRPSEQQVLLYGGCYPLAVRPARRWTQSVPPPFPGRQPVAAHYTVVCWLAHRCEEVGHLFLCLLPTETPGNSPLLVVQSG